MSKSDDLISRQALCEYALNQKDKCVTPNDIMRFPSAQQDCTECEEYDNETHSCPKYCEVIRKTADELQVEASCKLPERKTGRWIDDGYAFRGGIDWMHCSECGHKDSWSAATRTPFCAWCGARMEGEG